MRLWLLALMLALAASALLVGSAFADASTYHQNYTSTTRACAGCHRAHTGQGDNLIKTSTTYGLCTSCHGWTNGLDVMDGAEWQTDSAHVRLQGTPPTEALKGGGFALALMNTDLNATQPSWPHTATVANPANANDPLIVPNSAHRINGMPILGGTVSNMTSTTYSGPGTVWGIGAIGSGAGSSFTMECSTCHDPHGQSGPNGEPTYRLLRSNMSTKVSGSTGVYVPEDAVASHDYAVDAANVAGAPWSYYGQTYNNALTNVDVTKISQFCAGCHTRVHADGASAGTSSGDSIYNFRHRTDGNSFTNNFGTTVKDGGGAPACLTCHVAHGSNAAMTRQAAEVPKPGTAEGGGTYLDGSLLRVDNRGVCELCHNK